jgi:small-conductance mechanosensitive channel
VPPLLQLAGPFAALQIFGVKLVGFNAENGKKVLFSLILLVVLLTLSKGLAALARRLFPPGDSVQMMFWSGQLIHLVSTLILIIGLLSIWFDDPTRLTTALGLISAGIAFALQRVITAFAGYFVILRGNTFNVGDRIVMGGVRGDVIALGFIRTTVMEMGQPVETKDADPAVWVRGRQYTGRIATITNDKIFDEPVYNYSRDFPYLWEEIAIPIAYDADRKRAEEILLEATRARTVKLNELGEEAIKELERRFLVRRTEMGPRVYYRLTDNWLEMSVRFLTGESGVRDMKDAISRDIIARLDEAKIGIASGTYNIVGVPPVHVVVDSSDGRGNVRKATYKNDGDNDGD